MASVSERVGFAYGALLLGMLVSCTASTKTAPGTGSDAGQAGAFVEPTASGGNGGDPGRNEAGEPAGGTSSAGGDPSSLGGDNAGGVGAGGIAAEIPPDPAYGASVESFTPGPGAGFNQDKLPDIVLGPPQGKGTGSGTLDVLSLGAGGEIVLGFGELGLVDGPGADLLVFENAFWPGGDKTMVFAELGEVSVSEDGQTWHTFPCDAVGDGQGNFAGCAGATPTLAYDAATLVPLDPEQAGGDAFDLADVGLEHARFVKIRDLETQPPGGNTTGFDLDAVAAIHAE
ncbi:MAG: cell surface protein [Myxococcales bacterium]